MPNTFHQDTTVKNITYGQARCQINFSDLTAEADTESILWSDLVTANGGSNVPANARIMYCWVNLITPFAGGTSATAVIDVGDAGTVDELISAINVFTGADAGIKPKDGVYTLGTFEAAYAPKVAITITSDDVDNLTAGKAEIVIAYEAISPNAYL